MRGFLRSLSNPNHSTIPVGTRGGERELRRVQGFPTELLWFQRDWDGSGGVGITKTGGEGVEKRQNPFVATGESKMGLGDAHGLLPAHVASSSINPCLGHANPRIFPTPLPVQLTESSPFPKQPQNDPSSSYSSFFFFPPAAKTGSSGSRSPTPGRCLSICSVGSWQIKGEGLGSREAAGSFPRHRSGGRAAAGSALRTPGFHQRSAQPSANWICRR